MQPPSPTTDTTIARLRAEGTTKGAALRVRLAASELADLDALSAELRASGVPATRSTIARAALAAGVSQVRAAYAVPIRAGVGT